MLRYAGAITQPDGSIPLLGSSVHLRVGGLDRAVYGPLAQFDRTFAWMRTGGARGVQPTARVAVFPTARQVVLRSAFLRASREREQTSVLFNVGRYRTAHSQHDQLSLTYYSAGRSLLPDSKDGVRYHRHFAAPGPPRSALDAALPKDEKRCV